MSRTTHNGETWKCVLVNKQTRGRLPFFAHTPWAAKQEAKNYMTANKVEDNYTLTEPKEIFKKGIAWNVAVAI